MVVSPVKLSKQMFNVIPAKVAPFEVYGCWNALVAVGMDGELLGWTPAHDGDFYPESVSDYVEALRANILAESANTFPVRVDIDITQNCNSHCTFCFSRPYQHQSYRGAWITESDLRDILSKCAEWGTTTVRYCGGGEPLIHPRIDSILRLPREYGMKLCVITNGDFLDAKLAQQVVDHVDHLRWSVNAAREDTRRAIQRPGKSSNTLSKTKEWIKFIARSTKSLPMEHRTMIWATYLLLPGNVDEIHEAALALREVGVNSLSFRPVFHGLHSAWSQAKLMALREALEVVRTLERPPGFRVFIPKRDVLLAAHLNPNDYFTACYSRKYRAIIEATTAGALLQPCGLHRGNMKTGWPLVAGRMQFRKIWDLAQRLPPSFRAPQDCCTCIDVSMNRTLAFIGRMIRMDPGVQILRAQEIQ